MLSDIPPIDMSYAAVPVRELGVRRKDPHDTEDLVETDNSKLTKGTRPIAVLRWASLTDEIRIW